MNILHLLRVLLRNWLWLLAPPMLTAMLVIVATSDMPKEYQSNASIYTGLASGYNLNSVAETRIDYFAVNTAFDNLIQLIKARETTEEVCLKLMAKHLALKQENPQILSFENYKELNTIFPDTLIFQCRQLKNEEEVFQYLQLKSKEAQVNKVIQILQSKHPYYGTEGFAQHNTVARKGNSDVIEISFRSTDPAVSKTILDLQIAAFSLRYKEMKGTQTSNVAGYFESQVIKAKQELLDAEERLKNFMVEKKIINYYEQSRFVAETKESIEMEINQEKMSLEAAKSALAALEAKLGGKIEIVNTNTTLLALRDRMAQVKAQIAKTEIYSSDPLITDSLKRVAARLENEYKEKAIAYYANSYTPEASPQTDLLSSWLDKVVMLEEAKGRLRVYEARRDEHNRLYEQFAPWGSQIARMEREVRVNEEYYLSVLHALNQAKLQKQNLEYANSLKIIDHPYIPLRPEKSKRALLVILGFIAPFSLISGTIIGKELLDNSVKSPRKVVQETGLNLLGALPYLKEKEKRVNLEGVHDAMMEQCISCLLMELPKKSPKIVLITSNLAKEGKSRIIGRFQDYLESIGFRTLALLPDSSSTDDDIHPFDHAVYPADRKLILAEKLDDLGIPSNRLRDYDLVFVELPEFLNHPTPSGLLHYADLIILVINSRRVWTESDKHLQELVKKSTPQKQMVLLNAVTAESLEELMGDIPKKRHPARATFKKWMRMSFRSTKL